MKSRRTLLRRQTAKPSARKLVEPDTVTLYIQGAAFGARVEIIRISDGFPVYSGPVAKAGHCLEISRNDHFKLTDASLGRIRKVYEFSTKTDDVYFELAH